MIRKYQSTKDLVGKLNTDIINLLKLKFETQNIYIGGTNKKHIREKHKKEFDKYMDRLPKIISKPTYVGVHPSQGGIEFIKRYDENVLVAVRASKKDVLYVRSIYCITNSKIKKYLKEGTIKKVP
jgi:hypothetical protein